MHFKALLVSFLLSFSFLSSAQAQNFERMFTQDWSWGDLFSGNKSAWENLRSHLNSSEEIQAWCDGSGAISLRTDRYRFYVERHDDGTVTRRVTQANGSRFTRVDRQNYHEYIFRELIPVAQSCGIGGGVNSSVTRQIREARQRVNRPGQGLIRAIDKALPGAQGNN